MSVRRIALSALIIVLVMGGVAGFTYAYFGSNLDGSATITTAKIGLGSATDTNVSFADILPGESQSQSVRVQNASTRQADFYIQMYSGEAGDSSYNFCTPDQLLTVTIQELDGPDGSVVHTWYNDDMCNLFPGWSGSIIPKIADNVDPTAIKYYRITVSLHETAGNGAMDKNTTSKLRLIAVQFDGPALTADTTSGAGVKGIAWPQGDPNYLP